MSQLQKALVIPTLTGTPEVQSVPRPAPTSGQVVVKVVAAALNPADWKAHVLKIWPEYYPLTLGWDGAGEVEAVASDVSDFSKGDRVIFQGWQDEKAKVLHGTFQQYVAVPTHIIAKIPDNVSFDEAATLFTGLATAANPLYSHKPGTESLRLSPPWENGRGKYTGKSILILGGAGQVGQFAIQFAKLSGFGPIIVTASPHNAALLKPYGATHVIDRKLPTESIVADIHAIVGESGIDLVFDAVSEDNTLALAAAAVREGGQAVVVAPHKAEIFPKLFGPKHVEWVIARGVQSSERNKGALAGLWRELSALLEEGTLTPTKYELLGGLEAVPGGMERMQRNEVSGIKLVVHPHDTQ